MFHSYHQCIARVHFLVILLDGKQGRVSTNRDYLGSRKPSTDFVCSKLVTLDNELVRELPNADWPLLDNYSSTYVNIICMRLVHQRDLKDLLATVSIREANIYFSI